MLKKTKFIILIAMIAIMVVSLTVVFTVAYYTDRKTQSVTLMSADIDYSITARIKDSDAFDKYGSSDGDIREIEFTIANNSANGVYNNIGLSASLFLNQNNKHTDDFLFYPSDISNTEIYNEISSGNFIKNYKANDEFNHDIDFGQIFVEKNSTKTFTVKFTNKSDINAGNVADLYIMAAIYTGNNGGGYGFIEHLEENYTGNDGNLYYFLNLHDTNRDVDYGYQSLTENIEYMQTSYTSLVNLKSLDIIDENLVEFFDEKGKLSDYGLTLNNETGVISGSPVNMPDDYTIKFKYNDTALGYGDSFLAWMPYSDKATRECVGEIKLNFTRVYIDFNPNDFTIDDISVYYTYDGSEKKPEPVIKYKGSNLIKGIDYDLSYSNNINVGTTAKVIITGKGKYRGTLEKSFTINKANSSVTTAPAAKDLTYNGSDQILLASGSANGGTIMYRIKSYTDNSNVTSGAAIGYNTTIPHGTEAGKYIVSYYVKGDSNHSDSSVNDVEVTISKALITNATVSISGYTYGGTKSTPSISGNISGGTVTYYGRATSSGTATNWNDVTNTTYGAGTRYCYAVIAATNNYNSYTTSNTSFTVNKGASFVSSVPTAKTLIYSNLSQTLINAGSANGGTMMYKLVSYTPNIGSKSTYTNSWSKSLPQGVNAGIYEIQYYVAGDANHTDTSSSTINVTIDRASFTGAVVSISGYTYGGTKSMPSISGNISGGSVTYYGRATSGGTATNWNSVTNTTYDAGTRYCYAVIGATNNYNSYTTSNASFTINKANQLAPTSFTATPTSITSVSFSASGGGEQGSLQYSKDGSTWYTSSLMDGLTADTDYTFYVRWSGNNNYNASSTRTTTAMTSYYTWSGNTVTGLSELGKNLTDINIPDRATAISNIAFSNNTKLKKITNLGNSVTTIGDYAFYGCSGLTGNLTIPDSVTTIGYWAFNSCSGFTGNLTIPNSVTTIGYGAFSYCIGFNGNLIIPDSVTTIGDYAFNSCSGFDGNLTISNNLTLIGNRAFANCSSLTGNLTIPNSVTTIGDSAFMYCSGFTGNLTIPDSVTTIGDYAFEGCTSLKYISIDKEQDSISGSPWRFPKGSDYVYWLGDFTWDGTIVTGFTETAKANKTDINIPPKATAIKSSAFQHNTKITKITSLGDNVTSIGDGAFYGCSNLTGNLTIPNSVTTIADGAFMCCSGFNGNLTISNSVKSIGEAAFRNCTGLTGNLTIPDSVTSIGAYAFNNCRGFNGNLTISNSVTTISKGAFEDCSGFTGNLIIPNSVASIGEYAFYNCSKLETINVPESVTSIGREAFAEGPNNQTIYIDKTEGSISGSPWGAKRVVWKTITVTSWKDVKSATITISNTGSIDDCYNLVSGSLTLVDGGTVSVKTSNIGSDQNWGNENESSAGYADLNYDGSIVLHYSDNLSSNAIHVSLPNKGDSSTITIPNNWLKYFANESNYSYISPNNVNISRTEYNNNVHDKGPYLVEGSSSSLPKSSNNIVILKEICNKSGDESEIYDEQMLLYYDGSSYYRTRYHWNIYNGWISNPKFGDWTEADSWMVSNFANNSFLLPDLSKTDNLQIKNDVVSTPIPIVEKLPKVTAAPKPENNGELNKNSNSNDNVVSAATSKPTVVPTVTPIVTPMPTSVPKTEDTPTKDVKNSMKALLPSFFSSSNVNIEPTMTPLPEDNVDDVGLNNDNDEVVQKQSASLLEMFVRNIFSQ